MLKDNEIIEQFTKRKDHYIEVKEWWFQNEVRENYCALEGDMRADYITSGWLDSSLDRRKADNLPVYYINKLERVVDSVCGFQIQNRTKIEYTPRNLRSPERTSVDAIANGVDYIVEDSRADYESSWAFRDMLTCGIGSTDATISYDENYLGETEVARIAPYLLGFDTSARKKNLVDANWCFAGTLVDKDAYKEAKEEEGVTIDTSGDDRFVNYFIATQSTADNLAIEYKYQWRVKEPFYLVKNPLMMLPAPIIQELAATGMVATMSQKFNFDPAVDEVFHLDTSLFKSFKDAMAAIGLDAKKLATKQKTYRYYWAIIFGKTVIEKGESFSQKSFTQKFMTGKFSEVRQCHYGIVRAMKPAQQLLTKAVNDFSDALHVNPQGGVIVEADAIPEESSLSEFVNSWSKMRNVTILESGAISGNKVMMKPVSDAPPAAEKMISYAERSILELGSVTPDFLGMGDSGQNAYDVYGQRVRQSLMTLAYYFDSYSFYQLDQGVLYIDCLRVLADNSGGYIIRTLTGNVVKIMSSDIEKEYFVSLKEVPKSIDQREKEIDTLIKVADMLIKSGRDGGAITPLIVENMDLPQNKVEEVLQLTAPPPPAPPDPVQTDLLIAETQLRKSTADKNTAEAMVKRLEALGKQKDLMTQTEKNKADVAKTISEVEKNIAAVQTAQTKNKGAVDDSINKRLDALKSVKSLREIEDDNGRDGISEAD